jgi:ferric-dicitrate binding protein FerR (iron transport regulator)
MDDLNQNMEKLEEEIADSADLLRMSAEVFARQKFPAPEVEKEWVRFANRKITAERKRGPVFLWSFGAGVAACAMVVLLLNIRLFQVPAEEGVANGETVVFEAIDNVEGITLSSESGVVHRIGGVESDSILAMGGIEVDENSIDLRHTTKEEMQTLTIPRGKSFKVVLADGTEVWLNAESRLYYPSQFRDSERVVFLEGEAYFKVSRDEKRPFVVNTGELRTHVLGTQFNVKSYSGNPQHITLVEGSVRVNHLSTNEGVYLKPGQDVCLNPEGGFVLEEVDTYGITQWKEGYFYFNNVALGDIVKDIGRWYNVDISFVNPSISKYHLHFVADRNAGLQHVLDNLNRLQKVRASFVDNRIVIQ